MPADQGQLYDDNRSPTPYFEKKLIEDKREDGYWIEPFQIDKQSPIGLIGYGLGKGQINFYQNPSATTEPGKATLIQKLEGPVGMDQADITGNGINDIIICFQYGNTMIDCDPEGGKIVWLENPGQNPNKKPWKSHYVGKSTAMHRLKVGHFTQTKRWEIIGLPIVSKPYDLLSPVPVLLFRQPDDVLNATEWPCEIINEKFFHLIHDAKKYKMNSLDTLFIASREGINWLYFNEQLQKWIIKNFGEGEQGEKQQTGYYGSACIDIGKVGNDSLAYIATVEPFHGNVIAVYTKTKDSQWKRYVLDVYGYPNEHGEGPAHHVICADFDKDGNDEFLVALRGPSPNQGVYYYKPIDLSRGLFSKWKITDDSAARIAVADFNNDGILDLATIGYYVPGYYTASVPSINMYYNLFVNKNIQVMKQDNELLFKVPRPNKALQYELLPFLTLGDITLSLEVIPPFSSRIINKNTYVKVIFGVIMWKNSSKKSLQPEEYSRTLFSEPKSVSYLEINSIDNRITTGNEGALLLVMTMDEKMDVIPQFDAIEKVIIKNSLPEYCSKETREFNFKFIKCDQFEWGKTFKGLEFYNLKGFKINFIDNDEHLCNIQLWAAGKGTNCGVHNHLNDPFCEIHVCLINGSGKSGMYYLKSSKQDYDPRTTPDSEFEKLEVPSFSEHGPLWDIDKQNKPILRTNGDVLYPWHKWQSYDDHSSIQSFDIWMAFEFNIQLSTLPSKI
jgi:hypothetical protein